MTILSRGTAAALGILVAMLLGFGAVEELVVRGVRGGEVQSLLVGLAGAFVSLLLVLAVLALWRHHVNARPLAIVAGIAVTVFHAYAALPPHRYVGFLVLALATVYGAALLAIALRHATAGPPRRNRDAGA
jgi:hypothetical protein